MGKYMHMYVYINVDADQLALRLIVDDHDAHIKGVDTGGALGAEAPPPDFQLYIIFYWE